MSATSFDSFYAFVERTENDGTANDTAVSNAGTGDGAGETRYGWIVPTWRAEAHHIGIADLSLENFRRQTPATLKPLARDAFWTRLRCDEMPAGPDIMVADFAFGSGGAVFEIQRQLGLKADGVIGTATLTAIAAQRPADFIVSIWKWRTGYYDRCGFRPLWPGLYRRARDCMGIALSLAGASPAAPAQTPVAPPVPKAQGESDADRLNDEQMAKIKGTPA
jgi:lysozyme family protein